MRRRGSRPGYTVLGLTVDAPRDRLFVLARRARAVQISGSGVGGVLLDTWRLADLRPGLASPRTPQPLRVPPTCRQVMLRRSRRGSCPSADGKGLFFGCLRTAGSSRCSGPNAGDVGGVAGSTSLPPPRVRRLDCGSARSPATTRRATPRAVPANGRFANSARRATNDQGVRHRHAATTSATSGSTSESRRSASTAVPGAATTSTARASACSTRRRRRSTRASSTRSSRPMHSAC